MTGGLMALDIQCIRTRGPLLVPFIHVHTHTCQVTCLACNSIIIRSNMNSRPVTLSLCVLPQCALTYVQCHQSDPHSEHRGYHTAAIISRTTRNTQHKLNKVTAVAHHSSTVGLTAAAVATATQIEPGRGAAVAALGCGCCSCCCCCCVAFSVQHPSRESWILLGGYRCQNLDTDSIVQEG